MVLEEFFELTSDGWKNSRADAEIAEMQAKQQKQRDKANARWDKQRAVPGMSRAPEPAMHRQCRSRKSVMPRHRFQMQMQCHQHQHQHQHQ